MQPAPAGALCAIHPSQQALGVCARCGNFTCAACNDNGAVSECPTCRALGPVDQFPLLANADFNQIWSYAFERFQAEWLMLCVVALIAFAIVMVGGGVARVASELVNMVAGLHVNPARPFDDLRSFVFSTGVTQLISPIVAMPFSGAAFIGVYTVCWDVLHGRKADVGRMFSRFDAMPRYLVVHLVLQVLVSLPVFVFMGIVIRLAFEAAGLSFGSSVDDLTHAFRSPVPWGILGAGLLVVVVVSVVVLPMSLFATLELLVSNASPMEVIRRTWLMGSGQRLRTFGYCFVVTVLLMLGGCACVVGALPAGALSGLIITSLFLVIRKTARIPQ